MNQQKISELIKGALKVNLSYSATLLNLSKDYLREMSEAVISQQQSATPNARKQFDGDRDTQTPSSPKKPASDHRIPLILAGRTGETANAAMAITNTSGQSGAVTLIIRGNFPGMQVQMDPELLSMEVGEASIIRVLAAISGDVPVDTDYPGEVFIQELNLKVADFVIRRLPDAKKKRSAPKKAPVRKKTVGRQTKT